MNNIHPVDELLEEHRLIESVLAALECRLENPGAAGFPAAFIEQAVDFVVNFADGLHHYKEEEALFPALARKGVPVEGGPIGVMLHEHNVGRKCIAGIRENLPAAAAGSVEAQEAVRGFAANYIQLLRQHIWKEDHILFQIARQALNAGDVESVRAQFHDQTNVRIRDDVRQRYEALANTLAAAV